MTCASKQVLEEMHDHFAEDVNPTHSYMRTHVGLEQMQCAVLVQEGVTLTLAYCLSGTCLSLSCQGARQALISCVLPTLSGCTSIGHSTPYLAGLQASLSIILTSLKMLSAGNCEMKFKTDKHLHLGIWQMLSSRATYIASKIYISITAYLPEIKPM